jgi:DNA sulfur modification protein DndE
MVTSAAASPQRAISLKRGYEMITLTLTDVLQASFRTSRQADSINEELRTVLGLPHRYGPARLAIARSLSLAEQPSLDPVVGDEPGRVIKGDQLFGTDADLGTWTALLVESAGRPLSKKELQDLAGAHWHRGAILLWQDWEESGHDYARFVRRLCEHAGLGGYPSDGSDGARPAGEGPPQFAARPIRLKLGDPGTDLATNQPLIWTLNAPGVSPHIAAMGTLGTGKTRTAINLLGQIKDQQRECAFVVFDFKGDLAESTSLVDALRPQIVRPPSVPVPLDVLAPSARDDQSLNEAALRFRESFARVAQSRPGGIQLDALRDAARLALGRDGVVRIEHVRDALADVYDTNIPRIYLTVGPGCVSDAGWKRGTSGASAGRRRRSCGGGRWF